MKSHLSCLICEQTFNNHDKIPKVLPCSDVACSSCLNKKCEIFLGEFLFKCTNCKKELKIANIDELPTSKLTLHLINQSNVVKTNLKQFNLNTKSEIYKLNKHYDNIINSVDIRTESLINFLCTSREVLIKQINEFRKQSISNYDSLDTSQVMKLKLSLEDDLNKLENDTEIDKHQVLDLLHCYDKLERFKYEIKKNCWYFDENSTKNDKSMLGFILNRKIERNYLKIKNLTTMIDPTEDHEITLTNPSQNSLKVRLNSPSNISDMTIRQHVLPLSRNKILKIYFTTKRTLHVESFDSKGNFINSVVAFEHLSSFPISYAYGEYFCLSFTAKTQINFSIYDSNQTYVLLLNSDLKCLKQISKYTSVESLFMNEKNVFIFYAHKTSACCEILDYDLNELETFGQQTDPERPFYMEKTNLAWKEQTSAGVKNNPKIFGFTDKFIYLFNIKQMFLIDRKTGKVLKTLDSNGDPAYYLLDSQSNILKVNSLCKRISLFNFEQEVFIQNKYSNCLDDVYLTNDDYLAFVDKNKEFVVFV